MVNTESKVEEAPTETVIGMMPTEYAERQINICNVRDDSLNDKTSKGYGLEEISRLRHLIFRFTEWFRPLISDVLSQDVNLAKFEELAIEGVSEIAVSNEVMQEKNLAEFEQHPVKGISPEIVVSNVPSHEENLSKFEELTMEGVGEIVNVNGFSQEGDNEIVVHNLPKFEELAVEGVSEIVICNIPPLGEKREKFEELPSEGNRPPIEQRDDHHLMQYKNDNNSNNNNNNNGETLRLEENLAKFEELALEGVGEIVFNNALSQEENLVKFEELAVEGVNEIVVNNIPDQGENLEKFEQLALEGNRPPIEQRDDHLNDHHSMQYRNDNNDNGETSRLEENLAKFEEFRQGGIMETATPFTPGGMRESVEQQNQSIIEHTNICEGDAKGGDGHIEYPNAAGNSDPNNDSGDGIEQIKVDAITNQRQDAPLLSHDKAIESPSTSRPSMKQPSIKLAEEESEMDQTTCNKNETLSARYGTPNVDSGISPSTSIQQEEENRPSNKRRLELNDEPTSDIVLEGEPSSLSMETAKTAEKNIWKVFQWLRENKTQIVKIDGDEGSGRTWTARQVMHIVVETGLFEFVIWLNVPDVGLSYDCFFQDMMMEIIDQLNLSSTTTSRAVQEMTEKSLRHIISETLADRSFLLILDDIKSFSLKDLDKLGVPPPSRRRQNKSSKVLFIGSKDVTSKISSDRVLSLYPLLFDEAWLLFCNKAGVAFDSPLAKALVSDCKGVPLKIIMLAGAMRNIKGDTTSPTTLGDKLEMVYDLRTINLLSITEISCAMLPSQAMKDCFLYCTLYPKYHHINVKGLITSWIIEGFLEGFNCLEDAYEKGQHILKELLDRYLLFKIDDDHVIANDNLHYTGMNFILEHERSDIILAKAGVRLTFSSLYTEKDSFRKIYLMDGTSLQTKYLDCPEFPKCSTLLLHGESIGGEIPDAFFQKMQNLRVLTLLHVGMRFLPLSLSNLKWLSVLVLRGCGNLEHLNYIRGLSSLYVLCLSGAHALKKIPDDFFETMHHLQALDLSDTHIKHLPSSLSNLQNLCHLILRGCSYLEELPHLKAAKQLQVLDLSGASALRKIDDRFFEDKISLVLVDLSGTVLDCVPSISNLKHIKYLSLRGCSHFDTLPCLEALNSLKVVDLSGASALRKFQDKSFRSNVKLYILDLSGTQIVQLSSLSECSSLCQLFLRGCSNLETLPPLPRNLELLDLSGSTAFKKFQDEFLEPVLQILDLSETRIVNLPSFPKSSRIRQLLLRGCLNLQTLPPLGNLERLQEIDLSASTAFQKFKDESFGSFLRILNVSETQVARLPSLSKCSSLSQLLLRGCLNLQTLPPLGNLELQEIDLSGSTAFQKFKDESFGSFLRILNLSETQVAQLPSLLKCYSLSQLLLRGCLKLEVLQNLHPLTELEVLDLSGAIAFKQLQDESFGQKNNLKKLDLSGTQVEQLPSLSKCTGLSHLLLSGCVKLKALENLDAVTKLEVLDLSGATVFGQFPDDSFEQKIGLQKLDLSGTQVENLRFLSKCSGLSQLLLRGCLKIETLPPLEALTRLEVLSLSGATSFRRFPEEFFAQKNGLKKLDLSGTLIEELSSLSNCSRLSQLLLRGCSKLQTLPPLQAFKRLEELNLFGATAFRRFPDEPFGQTNENKQLDLSGIHVGRPCINVTISNPDIFSHIGKKSDQLWEKAFQRIHICLCSLEEQGKEEDIFFQEKEIIFKDTYYTQTRWLPQSTEPDKFLEIRGFQSFPSGIEAVLNRVELLYLKKNVFITRLSDIGAENVKKLKECWIDSCDGMDSVFYGDETEENVALGRSLQNLWVSNLSELRTLCKGVLQSGSFTCLKNLYIDCCPSLINVFSSGLELKNLETLQIKFCDEIECVFGEMILGESALPRLSKLILWRLSELKCICGGVLPSLQNLKVGGCPKLLTLPLEINGTSHSQVEIEGELEWWEELKREDVGIKFHRHFKQL